MHYSRVANTDLEISALGLGTWVFGGDVWGPSAEAECLGAVDAALERGINFIDTAPIYGDGKAECIVGKAIKNRRKKVILATKCGLIPKGNRVSIDLSAESIKREIEQSLKRLQVDYIDLYQCHWPDPDTPIEWTMEMLSRLKEEKKIRHIGVCNFPLALLKRSLEVANVISLQSQYSILERSLEGAILPFCRQKGMGIIAYGVLGGGILSGKYSSVPNLQDSDARSFFYKYYKAENFDKVQQILRCLKDFSRPLNQIVINWIRQKEAVLSTLVGCRDAQQVIKNVQAIDWDLSSEEMKQIEQMTAI